MVVAMIRILLACFSLAAFAAPAAAAERRYSVSDYDRVLVEGPYRVRLVTGRPSSAVASGSREALDRIDVDVQGQTLRIRRNRAAWGGTPGAQAGPVTIELATRNVRAIRLVGPASLEADGVEGLNVHLTVEGSGSLRALNVAADNLAVSLMGSGRLDVAGTAIQLRIVSQGTGDIAASGLRAENGTVNTNSSGAVSVEVVRAATVTADGLGEVEILGRPACTVRGLGASQVRCGLSDQR